MNKIAIILAIATFVAVGETMSPTSPRFGSIRAQIQQENDNNNFCPGCRSMVSFMTHFNTTMDRKSAKETLQNYCEIYYPVSTDFRQGPCPMFVETLFYLMGRIDPGYHCDHIGACDSQSSSLVGSNNEVALGDGGLFCDVCEQVVTQIQGELEDPKIIDVIRRQVDSFCDYLIVIDQAKQCRQMVDTYVDQAVEFVRHLEPLKYCQSIAMCSATKQSASQMPSLASFMGFGLETKVSLGGKVVKDIDVVNTPVSSVKPRKLISEPTCDLCKVIAKEMFKFLKSNKTEENVRLGLDKVCKLVYGRNEAKLEHCEMMVASYSREFIQLLTEETDPELICMLLDQCTYQDRPKVAVGVTEIAPKEQASRKNILPVDPIDMNTFLTMLDSNIQLGSTRTCIECKLFIEYLQNQIKDPKSQEEMKQWLMTNLCQTLEEKKLKDSCDQLVEKYAETFFKAVSNELSPKATCQELNACSKKRMQPLIVDQNSTQQVAKQQQKTTNVIVTPQASPKNSVCDQCVEIVAKIDEYLSSHSVDHDFSVLIAEVCMKLPGDLMKQECTLLVNTFGDKIAQAISAMENPQQLCSSIYLC